MHTQIDEQQIEEEIKLCVCVREREYVCFNLHT
jgi:hypothetical protein